MKEDSLFILDTYRNYLAIFKACNYLSVAEEFNMVY